MARKTTWKSTQIKKVTRDQMRHLESIAENHAPWKKYIIGVYVQGTSIDTNLPWSELRVLFQSADLPMPNEWVISNKSIEELYADEI